MEKNFEKLSVRDVILYTGKVMKFNREEFEEKKRRPAVIIRKNEIDSELLMLAAPLNSTVKEAWNGPCVRYCISPTKNYVDYLRSLAEDDLETLFGVRNIDSANFNNIEKISQVAVNNVFFVEQMNFIKKIGSIDDVDYECINYMFMEYVRWLEK